MTQSPIREGDKDFVDQEVYCPWTAVKLEAAILTEMLADNCQSPYTQIPEQMNLCQHHCVNSKSWKKLQALKELEGLIAMLISKSPTLHNIVSQMNPQHTLLPCCSEVPITLHLFDTCDAFKTLLSQDVKHRRQEY